MVVDSGNGCFVEDLLVDWVVAFFTLVERTHAVDFLGHQQHIHQAGFLSYVSPL